MKRLRIALCLLVSTWLPFIDAIAETTVQVGDYYYILNETDNTASLKRPGKGVVGNVTFPEIITYGSKQYTVTEIERQAFYQCNNLTSVTIPNTVTTIGDQAFYMCKGITSVTIGESVITIGESAFCQCIALTSVTMGKSVATIGEGAFLLCSELTSVTMGKSVTTIGRSAFGHCSKLTAIEIPNSVKSIGEMAFLECSSLTSVLIPNSVETIGDGSFSGCTNMTSLTIGSSVTSIGMSAFHGCTSLTDLLIPNSVTTIGSVAFSRCNSLKNVTIGSSVTTVGSRAFAYSTNIAKVTYHCKEIENWIDGTNVTEIIIGDEVERIGPEAFKNYLQLSTLTIPNSVSIIENGAFYGCKSLSSVNIPNTLTSISQWLFYNCSSLEEIVIPNSVTTIGRFAFEKCTNLTSLIIPNSITTFEENTFDGCTGLKIITAYMRTPPNAITDFGNTYKTAKLRVPFGCKVRYQNTFNWKYFFDIEEMEPQPGDPPVLTLSALSQTLEDGLRLPESATEQLTVTVTPAASAEKGVTWTSSDTSVATVSADGLVTALKPGSATIKCTSNAAPDVSVSVNMSVYSARLNISHTTLTMYEGDVETITHTIQPVGQTVQTVTWQSSDTNVASVDNDGTVHAIGSGTATLTCTWTWNPDRRMTCTVTVKKGFVPPVPEQQATQATAEYFLDTDPGYGAATPLAAAEFGSKEYELDLGGAAPGAHILYIRCRDEYGRWSPTISRPIYVSRNIDIVALEYYFDAPAPGSSKVVNVCTHGKKATEVDFDIDTEGLALGRHQLFVRAKDWLGRWTELSSESFLVVEQGTGVVTVKLDFAFRIEATQSRCVITPQGNNSRNDCRVDVYAVDGTKLTTALWKSGDARLSLPVNTRADAVLIVKIRDVIDGRLMTKRVMRK